MTPVKTSADLPALASYFICCCCCSRNTVLPSSMTSLTCGCAVLVADGRGRRQRQDARNDSAKHAGKPA
eukprot:49168-Alexandrium_andersonii.AAC.1